MSKTSSFLCNSLKDCEEIGSFPKICLRAMLKGSMKNVLLVPGYQGNRGLFHQAPDFLCVRLHCYLGMWNDLRMGIANKMACGNVHWDLGHIWHCTLRCLISLQLGKASSCSSEKYFFQVMFLSLSSPSYMTSLFLKYEIYSWKKTWKCICYWPQFRFVGIQQASCCRTIPAVKSLSVKAVFHFSIHFSIHISKCGS